MTDDARDPHSGSPLRLKSSAATVPPDAETIADPHAREQPDQSKTILLVARNRKDDIPRVTTDAAGVATVLATSRVERRVLGRTGTGLVVEEVRIVDPVVEALRELPGQIRFVQDNLGHIVDMSKAPYEEDPAALIVKVLMEQCEQLNYRNLAVVSRVLQGRVEPEPILLPHAVEEIVAAHERWTIKRLAEEANAPHPAEEPLGEDELDELVLDEALERHDRDVEDVDPSAPPRMSETPTREPLFTDEERRALDDAAASMAVQADEVLRSPSPAARHRAHRRTAHAQTTPADKPDKVPAQRERAASVTALWVTACLLLALVVVVAGYLMRQDGQIRTASQERDAKQDKTLVEHTASIQSHARTLAQLVPELAEKDVKILDLTKERDGYAQIAVDSQEAIQALDERVGGQVGSLAREISETRSDLRRKLDEQAHQIEELSARLEQDEAGTNGDATPTP